MENVIRLLKETNARISVFNKWLVWITGKWYVYGRLPYAHDNIIYYRGESFDEALKVLEGEER